MLWLAYRYREKIIWHYSTGNVHKMEQEGEDEGEDPIQPCHPCHSAEMEQEDDIDTEVAW